MRSTPPIVVKAKMEELARDFPEGMRYEIRYDTTPFIRESIGEVFKTLREAVILVAIVVLLFLQNWRSAVIPLVAVPVAIIGTFARDGGVRLQPEQPDAVRPGAGDRHRGRRRDRRRRGGRASHRARDWRRATATIRAMDEVSGPVIAIGLVLTAVFVPCAFITGIVGQFFRQFALDDRRVDDHLGVQLADAQPGPGGAPAAAQAEGRATQRAPDRGVRARRRLARLVDPLHRGSPRSCQ